MRSVLILLGFAVVAGCLGGALDAVWNIAANDWLHLGLENLVWVELARRCRAWVLIAGGGALAFWVLRWLIRRWSGAKGDALLACGLGWATGLALVTWAGFHLNRYTFKDYWRAENARLWLGLHVPGGLLSGRVVLANLAVALAAVVLGAALQRWLRAALPWSGRVASRRPAAFAAAVGFALTLCVVSLATALQRRGSREAPNVVVISIDTLRADHLSAYGYRRETSPHIDALARAGVLFENAIAQSNWTLPSHMSLFTSQVPSAHGVRSSRQRLPAFKVTLAEILRNAGYATVGFTGGYNVDGRFGFDQGFDHYAGDKVGHLLLEEKRRFAKGVRISYLLPDVVEWLSKGRREPFFMFLHAWDTHAPYMPHEEYIETFSPGYKGPIQVVTHDLVKRLHEHPTLASADDVARIQALYDNEIRYVDAALGTFFARLDELGLRARTIIVFTSDHGDELLEHGFGHGRFLYEPEVRVPLIVVYPGVVPQGYRVRGIARLIDVVPTVLDLAGIETSEPVRKELQGMSLVQGWKGAAVARSALSEGRDPERVALRTAHYKLITSRAGDKGDELYDLTRDPVERTNLAEQDPERVRTLRAGLEHELNRCRETRFAGVAERMRMDAALEEKLKALGYEQ